MFGKLMKQAQDVVAKATGKEEPEAAAAKEEKKEEEPADQGMPREKAEEIAAALREAMKGFGTDEDALVKLVAPLTAADAEVVAAAYADTQKRDLVEDIKSECGGKFEDALVLLLAPQANSHAMQIREACKGMGTNEKLLSEVVMNLSAEEIQAANKAYRLLYEAFVLDVIKSEIGSGKLGKLLMARWEAGLAGFADHGDDADKIDEIVLRIFKAGEDKIGTDEKALIAALAPLSSSYIEDTIAPAYAKKHGSSLKRILEKELSGDLEVAFTTMVTPRHVVLAERLHKAMKGMGTDTDALVRLVCGNRPQLAAVSKYFLEKHDKSLARWVDGEISGDLRDLIIAVIKAHE